MLSRLIAVLACIVLVSATLTGCSSTSDPSGPQDDGPDASISYPPDNSVIDTTVEVTVCVTEGRSVACVDFYADNVLALSDSTSPYVYVWDAACSLPASAHGIRAVAYDERGRSGAPDTITVHSRWREVITDGDEFRDCNLKSISVRSTATLLEFRVEVYEGWVDAYDPTTGVHFALFMDTDCDSLTGMNESSGGGYAPNDIGAEFAASAGIEGDAVLAWSDSTYWGLAFAYEYIDISDNRDYFEAGISLENLSWPPAVDIVGVFLSSIWDWAPDTGHATYEITGDFIEGTTSRIAASTPASIPTDGRPMPLLHGKTE